MNTTPARGRDSSGSSVVVPPETIAAPFSDWITLFLLVGPAAAGVKPRDETTREEWQRIWGRSGAPCAQVWRDNEDSLRAAAAARSIAPRFRGRFFAEALAAAGR
jgi:hypothetical protein